MKPALPHLLAFGLSFAAPAQTTQVASPLPLTDFRVPIHGPQDPADAGDYGLWAAGRNFKASFHDGFVFHPALGSQRAGRSLRWRTERVSVGGEAMAETLAAASTWHDAWRFEYRRPGFTEAYDVRVDGVEQTFVFHERPVKHGDLVVRGRFETRLTPKPTAGPLHTALAFQDEDGTEVARYGAAFVVDGHGARLPITTACDGEHVELCVPAAWLQGATYPITIDPLTSAVAIAYGDTIAVDVAREHESATSNVMVFYTMRYAQSDWDSFAFLCNDDFSNPWLVYANISAASNAFVAGVAYAGGSDRWVMPITRRDALNQTPLDLRIEVRQRGDLQLNRGFTVGLPAASGEVFSGSFDVGGSESGTKVICAYVSKTGTATTVWARMFDATAATLSLPQRVGPSRGFIGSWLGVTKSNSGSDPSWVVTYDTTVGTFPVGYSIVCLSRIDPNVAGPWSVVEIGSQAEPIGTPAVDGRDGRYLLAVSAPFLSTIRVDWPQTSATPTMIGPKRRIDATLLAPPSDVAYDHVRDSHWCVTWQIGGAGSRAARVGYQGAVTEVVTLDPGISSPTEYCAPSVAFQPNAREFLVAHASHATNPVRLQGVRFLFDPNAVVTTYGSACGVQAGLAWEQPDAGTEFFTLRIGSLPAAAPCALVLGATQAAVPLGAGCWANVGHILTSFPAVASPRGAANVTFALPDAPLFQGRVYGQWAWSQSGALGTSLGLQIQVR